MHTSPFGIEADFGLGPDRVPVPFCVSFRGFERGFEPFSSVAPKSKPLEPYNFFLCFRCFRICWFGARFVMGSNSCGCFGGVVGVVMVLCLVVV